MTFIGEQNLIQLHVARVGVSKQFGCSTRQQLLMQGDFLDASRLGPKYS